MPEIVFPISSAPGVNATESGGRLINCMALAAPEGSRSKYLWRRPAGLRPAFEVGEGSHRGALKFGTTAIVANGTKAYSVTSAYGTTELTGDPLPGDDPLIMARNTRTTPQIIAISEDGASLIEGGVVSDYSDVDLPQPNSVTLLNGFFVFGIGDGRMFASGANDITVAGTDWTTAEAKPDGIVRVVAANDTLHAMGNSSLQFYRNAGQETGFPFSAAAAIPVGLKGRFAVAGFEEGWTAGMGFVASDNTVRLVSGYSAPVISEEPLQRLIEAVTDTDDLRMDAYVAGGVAFLSVTHRGSPGWTWEFNTRDRRWHERASYGLDNNWRGQFTFNAFDKWLALDTESNAVFKIDPTFKREKDQPLVWELRSVQGHRFPGRTVFHQASFDFLVGVGVDTGADPIETNPHVELSWSDDGGRTFGNPLLKPLGAQGHVVPVDQSILGMCGRLGRQWKLKVSDPVEVAFYGAAARTEERAA